jgi:hypothetical protein
VKFSFEYLKKSFVACSSCLFEVPIGLNFLDFVTIPRASITPFFDNTNPPIFVKKKHDATIVILTFLLFTYTISL